MTRFSSASRAKLERWARALANGDLALAAARLQASLEGFDATAHRLHNISADITGDRAVVRCIVDAAHFIAVSSGVWSYAQGPAAAVKAFNERLKF